MMISHLTRREGRFEPKDKFCFYKIPRGSAVELISQMLISCALAYASQQEKNRLIESNKEIIGELNAPVKTA